MANAMVHKFGEALNPNGDADLPATEATVLDLMTGNGKKKNEAKSHNFLAVSAFTLAFTNKI